MVDYHPSIATAPQIIPRFAAQPLSGAAFPHFPRDSCPSAQHSRPQSCPASKCPRTGAAESSLWTRRPSRGGGKWYEVVCGGGDAGLLASCGTISGSNVGTTRGTRDPRHGLARVVIPMPFLAVLPLFLVGLVGAWLAKGISHGDLPWWLPVLPSVGTGLLWGWVSRRSSDLSLATVVFDVVYTGAFLAGFLLLGDRLSLLQSCGVGLALLGVALMSL